MGQTIKMFGREVVAEDVISVELKRPSYEQKLIWRRVQTTLSVIVGGVFAYLLIRLGSDWFLWILTIGGLLNIPFAIGAWLTPHVPKWQVVAKYSHLNSVEAVESNEIAYWTRAEAVAEAHKIFDEMQAMGLGEAHRMAFERKYERR